MARTTPLLGGPVEPALLIELSRAETTRMLLGLVGAVPAPGPPARRARLHTARSIALGVLVVVLVVAVYALAVRGLATAEWSAG